MDKAVTLAATFRLAVAAPGRVGKMQEGGVSTRGHAMSLPRAWMVPVGLLLVVGPAGCEVERRPVAQPEPIAEPSLAEKGRDAAIAAIERLGGRVGYDEEGPDRAIVDVCLDDTQVTDAGVNDFRWALLNCQIRH